MATENCFRMDWFRCSELQIGQSSNLWTLLDIDELEALRGFYSEIGRLKSMKKKVRDMETRLNGSNICLVRVPKVKGKRNREAIWQNNGQEYHNKIPHVFN